MMVVTAFMAMITSLLTLVVDSRGGGSATVDSDGGKFVDSDGGDGGSGGSGGVGDSFAAWYKIWILWHSISLSVKTL